MSKYDVLQRLNHLRSQDKRGSDQELSDKISYRSSSVKSLDSQSTLKAVPKNQASDSQPSEKGHLQTYR